MTDAELIERLRHQSQIHAQEARTANATIAEIHQLCSGGNGEPGNWHGAAPVRELVRELQGLRAARMAYASEFPANEDGEPDVGSIHQNIRKLKAEAATLRQQAGRVDAGMVELVARAIAESGVGRPWDDLPELAVDDLDQSDMLAYARAAIAALAQNTQGDGEPVAWLHTVTQGDGETDQALSFSRDSFPLDTQLGFRSLGAVPLYLHAERARVPEGMALVPREMVAEAVQVLRNVDTQFRATGQPSARIERAINALSPLAAAPSQRAEVK